MEDSSLQPALDAAEQIILGSLEGDLTKIVYLSTLRDNNTGTYFHSSLSELYGVERADRALAICHRNIFMQLVKVPVSEYVEELRLYMRFCKVNVVAAWRRLQPYRATIPLEAPQFLVEIYCHNIEVALLILQNSQEAPGDA